MSSISSLEAELRRQQSINNELRRELGTIENGVNRAHRRLEEFNQKINNSLEQGRNHLDMSHQKLSAAIETQAEIEQLYKRFKAMELANKRIRECNNKIFYEFSNYSKVRKIVQGMMDNLDVNMVSDKVIYKSIEHAHLRTPDYWLTCVLISIMAWKNDDRDLADRAMAIALDLDKKSSSIFYMLFNLRMNREEAALKWFMEYQKCDMKGSDQRTFLLLFSLVSRCINSSEEISEKSREEINTFLRKVIKTSVEADGYSVEEMVALIREHLTDFEEEEQIDYGLMRKYCKDFGKFRDSLWKAKANVPILEFVRETVHIGPEERSAFIKEFIDELVAKANSQEKGVYEEIEYNELIISMEGDVDKAKEIFGKKKVHDEKEMNIIYEMIQWVYGADKEDVNAQSRMNMFTLTKELQAKALEERTEEYRLIDRRYSEVQIEDYSTTVDFANIQEEKNKTERFCREKRDQQLATIKDWPAYVGFGLGVAAAVAAFFVGYGLFAVAAICLGFGAIKLLSNRSGRKEAEQNYQLNARRFEQTIDNLYQEYQQYDTEYHSFDAYSEDISKELAGI